VLPVFLNYPIQEHTPNDTFPPFFFSGGFGLHSGRIGTIFTLYGIACGAIQFVLFPPLCARFGVLNCYRTCVLIFPVVYCLLPFTVLIDDMQWRYGTLFALLVIKAFAVIVGFPCSTILLTNSAASLSILGTLNGLATTFSALGRASGPALAGVLFSWGVKNNMIGAPWWFLGFIAAVGSVPVWMIVEEDGPTASNSPSAGSSDVDEDTDDTQVADRYQDAAVFEDDDSEDDIPVSHSNNKLHSREDRSLLRQDDSQNTATKTNNGYGTIQ
jgi:hypothetical protein